jgi:hypothetical protein
MGDLFARTEVQVFALRAREYSDEVARMGKFRQFGQAFLDAVAEVDRRCVLCEKAREELGCRLNHESGLSAGTLPRVTRSV